MGLGLFKMDGLPIHLDALGHAADVSGWVANLAILHRSWMTPAVATACDVSDQPDLAVARVFPLGGLCMR